MKQQVLFFFFTLMLTGISVSAQTGGGRIAGVVIDNAGEEPLPGATIFIEELKKGIVTDGHGGHPADKLLFGRRLLKIVAGADRSEERRVGKECRSRWSPYH